MTDDGTRAGRRDRAARESSAFSTDIGSELGLNVRIERGSPTPTEIAAVTAVLSAAVVEELAKAPEQTAAPSDWQLSQRSMQDERSFRPGRHVR
ncbi:acyl-CoA carboxylase subunit epsilon [Mycetocola zhujimingii]|uniref:Acyl-CoA carboxylase subunit epsilon n=1 Tax=Mycetocola zhujimingii TaxID=2079792 RepID=A0A2U1TF20_9MICO|nr:acyl-CoA carboxylase subunit epsilon [Mycetocola zhujimingii]AWB85777.1 hypothetical protein C3E77_03520 [Mycetocola zhujimingii]PWC07481.1 acyl-CoA carboxylase subunit epsilon [Mycetocola zhujimingii]